MTSAEAFKLVSSPQLAGKYKSWHCTEYALALAAELEHRQVRYARIHYTWWESDSPLNMGESKPEHAMHVITYFLTYDNGVGWQQWLADNENAKPVQVSGPLSSTNAMHWIKGFGSPFGGPMADIGSVYISAYWAMQTPLTFGQTGLSSAAKATAFRLPIDAGKSILFAVICYLLGISLLISAALVLIYSY
jgi:hypothetical protein